MDEPRVLVAIEKTSLLRVVEHLFRDRADLAVEKFTGKSHQLGEQAARKRPQVIVADQNLLGSDAARTIETIRDRNPEAKLILIDSFDWRRVEAGEFLVDACVSKSKVVRCLVPIVQKLTRGEKRQPRSFGGFNERAPRGVRME